MVESVSIPDSLARIAQNADLDAWAFVATSADADAAVNGPLRAVPFGVKDIIDVARMPTSYGVGSELRRARFDAWCVACLRAAGAVPVGKTRTTAYAYRDPAPTFNPRDRARTPGGSSAGSAAAVAAGHVPFALGTQTIGSVLRPAAYCGVVGFKPTWGRIPVSGVSPLAPSLDHIGVIAHDVATVRSVSDVLLRTAGAETGDAPLRVAVAGNIDDAHVAPAVRAALSGAFDKLNAGGIELSREALPFAVSAAPIVVDLIAAYEAYACLGSLLAFAPPPELRALLERGRSVASSAYASALDSREAARGDVEALLRGYDAVIVPGVDEAPSRETTGDGSPFAAWSYFGVPAIGIPIGDTSPPISLQIVAASGNDARLLEVAAQIESLVR